MAREAHCGTVLGLLECEEVKSPTSSQETVLFNGLLDLSLSWGSLNRIYEERQNAGWKTSIWYCGVIICGGVVLVVHRDRLQK